MRINEKALIKKAISFIESDNGYHDGMAILYTLIGNKNYQESVDRMRNSPTISLSELWKRYKNERRGT
jgi:hypothetical protein